MEQIQPDNDIVMGAPDAVGLIKDVDSQGFVAEVLKGSNDVPVLVDFWAPWCDPCKQLGPVLEKVVAGYKGKVRMVKVNLDENQQIAAQMGVQSIPAVFAFYKGQPVDGFMGAQPESALRAFVDKLLQISGGQLPEAEQIVARGEVALDNGDLDAANELFASLLEQDPVNAGAYAGLVKVALAANQAEEAKAMLAEAPREIVNSPELASLRARLDLLEETAGVGAHDANALEDLRARVDLTPDDPQLRYDYALALYAAGGDKNTEAAVDQLVEVVRRARDWQDDAARKQLVKIFEALGVMHLLSVAGRRKLSSVLFS